MEKERRTKALVLSALVIVVATLSIAFASLSRTLSINGIAKMDTASWSVYFDNLSEATITRGASEVSSPSISDDKGAIEDINVKLSNPKDEISYTVDVVNDGTIDAEVTLIEDIELTDAQKKIFIFKVTYTETGEEVKDGDLLSAGNTKNLTITIKFNDDITEEDLPSESQTISLSYQITYTQYDGSGEDIGLDSGETRGKSTLAAVNNKSNIIEYEDITEPFFNCTSIVRNEVESVSFLNNATVPTDAESTSWDASSEGDNSIIGWYQDTDSNGLYEVYVGSDNYIYAPSDSSALFAFFLELKELNLNNFYTSDVTDMTYMFIGCIPLQTLDVSNFDTSNVTSMLYTFMGCNALTYLDVSNWDTSNVTTMESMFSDCNVLGNIDVSNWNTSNITSMKNLFQGCEVFTSIDVSSFDTNKVTDMANMFSGCTNLTSLNLSNFVLLSETDIEFMFSGCSSLTVLDIRNFEFDILNSFTADRTFRGINTSAQIIVKDETQRTILTTNMSTLTNVVIPSEL